MRQYRGPAHGEAHPLPEARLAEDTLPSESTTSAEAPSPRVHRLPSSVFLAEKACQQPAAPLPGIILYRHKVHLMAIHPVTTTVPAARACPLSMSMQCKAVSKVPLDRSVRCL